MGGIIKGATYCLDTVNHTTTFGTPLALRQCAPLESQTWAVIRDYLMIDPVNTVLSGKAGICAVVSKSSSGSEKPIVLGTCSSDTYSQWGIY